MAASQVSRADSLRPMRSDAQTFSVPLFAEHDVETRAAGLNQRLQVYPKSTQTNHYWKPAKTFAYDPHTEHIHVAFSCTPD